MTVFLEFPISVVQRTNLSSLQPARDAMEVKSMVTHSPSHCALLRGDWSLISLAFNAKIHDVVAADSAIVDHDVPSPKSDGIPLFDFKSRKKQSQDFSTFLVQNIFNYLFFSPRQEEEGISSSLSTSILFWLELNWRVKLENSGNSLFDDQNATKIRVQKQQLTLHIHLSTWTTKESKIDGKSQSW